MLTGAKHRFAVTPAASMRCRCNCKDVSHPLPDSAEETAIHGQMQRSTHLAPPPCASPCLQPGERASATISFTFPLRCYSQLPITYTNWPCVLSDMLGIELLT